MGGRVLASRVSGCLLDSLVHENCLKLIIEFSYLLIIPMTLIIDIMPYFDEFIHVYG